MTWTQSDGRFSLTIPHNTTGEGESYSGLAFDKATKNFHIGNIDVRNGHGTFEHQFQRSER